MRRRFFNNNIKNFDINDYLTIEALEDNLQVYFPNEDLMYGIDGLGWQKLVAGAYSPAINKGQTISFKCNVESNAENSKTFTITKRCNLLGNCMSLASLDVLNFSGLFKNCTTIVSVSKNFLPATTLADYCYRGMFSGCTNLTTAPELPATTLADSCYTDMFIGCTSLTTAPALPATTLADRCYKDMFNDCTKLVNAPELPATTLKYLCYSGMFSGCTNLTTAPELPATTLADSCYTDMFIGCTSLTTAPALPATTLKSDCYSNMFRGCTKLNYIKMLATKISADGCLYNWVYGVASSGTFVKNPAMNSLPTGVSGIPSGWTVVNDGEESGGNLITFTVDNVEYQAEEGMTWNEWLDSPYNVDGYYAAMYSIPEIEIIGRGITLNGHDFISILPNNKATIVSPNGLINGEKYYLITL